MNRENIYGHHKKLNFILTAIRNFSIANSKKLTDIKVLDFGCGNGTAVSYQIAGLGVLLTGIDLHQESIEFAEANNPFPKNAKFIYGNEDKVLDSSESFDIVVYSDIIEHLNEPQRVLKKIRQVHKDSGIIIVAIPNGYGPFEIEKFISKYLKLEWLVNKLFGLASKCKKMIIRKSIKEEKQIPYNIQCKHVQFITIKSFRKLMENVGYRILQMSNGAFLGAPVSERFLRFEWFIDWNVKVADKLPSQFVSTWYFVCEKMK